VVYLVNLSEKDVVRKKNKWLARIKQWIDTNNPGDPLIPFSVSFEERLASLSAEDKKAEEEKVGANSALPKITHAGYTCLEVSWFSVLNTTVFPTFECHFSSSDTSPAVLTKFVHGLFGKALKHPKLRASFSMSV